MNHELTYPDGNTMSQRDAIAYVQDICASYGLYSNIVSVLSSGIPESDRNHSYIIVGTSPIYRDLPLPEHINPEAILRSAARSDLFFNPNVWVYDITENPDLMLATDSMIEYCKDAEFLGTLYKEYQTDLPDVLRKSEIAQLKDAWAALHHPDSPVSFKEKVQSDLKKFFKRERDVSKKEWLKYYRSDRFPDGKSMLVKTQGFYRRKEQEVDLEQLRAFNGDIKKLVMQEHEYRIFRDLIAKLHPDVTYSAGKKVVVDHGLLNSPEHSAGPFGKSVSGEEYAVIRKQRFAEEGWAALADLNMSYWETREINYKDVDEPLVAAVYNKIILEYAKCNSLAELHDHGQMHLKQIPASDFMNFVSLAKANGLRFYIDTDGLYSIPALKHINVIYNDSQIELMQTITRRMMCDKVDDSHIMNFLPLQERLSTIEPPSRSIVRESQLPCRD